MKAVILSSFGGPDHFQFADWPKAEPRTSEVSLQILAASFNPLDYQLRRGQETDAPSEGSGTLPVVLGRDLAGSVVGVGSGVTDLCIGDAVYAYLGGPKSNGSYAEYVCTPAAFVAKRPLNVSVAQAAALPTAGLTAYQCVISKANVRRGESVLITGGAGGVGSVAIQLARYLGAAPILTTAGSDGSIEYLMSEVGVPREHILDYRGLPLARLEESVREKNGGKPVRAAFDFVGGSMTRLCCGVIDFDGQVVSIVDGPGKCRLDSEEDMEERLFSRSATYHFVLLSARARTGGPETWSVYREQLEALTELVEAGHLKPPRVTEVGGLSVESVRRAHVLLEERHVQGKLVMTVPSAAEPPEGHRGFSE
jgi:NADPH:quinone reductase-like Zn-dependent oxidoreductase